jgi:hypothetical protein
MPGTQPRLIARSTHIHGAAEIRAAPPRLRRYPPPHARARSHQREDTRRHNESRATYPPDVDAPPSRRATPTGALRAPAPQANRRHDQGICTRSSSTPLPGKRKRPRGGMCRLRGRRPPEHRRNYVRRAKLRLSRYFQRGNFGASYERRSIARPRAERPAANLSYCDHHCILQRRNLFARAYSTQQE